MLGYDSEDITHLVVDGATTVAFFFLIIYFGGRLAQLQREENARVEHYLRTLERGQNVAQHMQYPQRRCFGEYFFMVLVVLAFLVHVFALVYDFGIRY